jgi:hypothetical protein
MTFDDFNRFQLELIDEVLKMRDTKGKEYANSTNRFANFDRLSEQLGLTNIQIAWVYIAKHLDAIQNYIKTGKSFSTEPIRGRIVDALTYLTLIAGMIEEKNVKYKEFKNICNTPIVPMIDKNEGKQQPFEYDPKPGSLVRL